MSLDRRTFTLSLASLAVPATLRAGEPLRIGHLASISNTIAARVLQQVYRRAGLSLELLPPMTATRSAEESDNGRTIGEVARIAEYGALHPRLIQIKPPLYIWSIHAFYKKSAPFQIKSVADLDARSVALVKGVQGTAALVGQVPNAQWVSSYEQLFKMLAADRFEVAIEGAAQGTYLIRTLGLQGITSVELLRYPLYHYLHEKHRDLVPVIGAQLQKLSNSGELKQMFEQATREYHAKRPG